MIIRCTQVLLREMGLKHGKMPDVVSDVKNLLSEWYAHMFYYIRSKCVIFTNAETLFSFVVHNVKRDDIRKLDDIFCKAITKALYDEDFRANNISSVTRNAKETCYAKTINRSIIGSINDFVKQYKYFYSRYEDNAIANIALNMTPMGAIEWKLPIEMLKTLFPDESKDMSEKAKKYLKRVYEK